MKMPDKTITLRVDSNILDKIGILAKHDDRSRSSMIRKILSAAVADVNTVSAAKVSIMVKHAIKEEDVNQGTNENFEDFLVRRTEIDRIDKENGIYRSDCDVCAGDKKHPAGKHPGCMHGKEWSKGKVWFCTCAQCRMATPVTVIPVKKVEVVEIKLCIACKNGIHDECQKKPQFHNSVPVRCDCKTCSDRTLYKAWEEGLTAGGA